tara:strand:+ start:2540 stop:2944 length:405 start_codon:yes stop_codon:yes gene_type:complete
MTTHDREVNNRKNREYRNLPFTKSQEEIQAEDELRFQEQDIERCAGQLAKLYRSLSKEGSYPYKELDLQKKVYRAAGDQDGYYFPSKEQAAASMKNDRKELLKVSNMSSFDKYLESDSFWRGVRHSFEMEIGLI